jgi:transcriptional regulator with XRE-family HTH domain
MKLGEQIKATRAAQGVTQKSLAEASGLTERTIQRIENHEVEPSAYSLRRIGLVLSF